MCPTCVRSVHDVFYCENCLAQVIGIPAAQPVGATPITAAGIPVAAVPPPIQPGPVSRPANAGIAFLLGLIPGLGAVYNGEYNKAIMHVFIFAGIIVGITGAFGDNLVGFFIVALVCFVFYMAIDAVRSAKARETGQPVTDPFENWTRNRAMGPFLLIGAGALFLLNNFGLFDFFRVRQIFWPLVLIGVGFLMLKNRVQK
jgi:Domain of unknown function (DUF5668)